MAYLDASYVPQKGDAVSCACDEHGRPHMQGTERAIFTVDFHSPVAVTFTHSVHQVKYLILIKNIQLMQAKLVDRLEIAAPTAEQKPRAEPCHTEIIKHYGKQDIPQRIIDEAVDRGEKAVRRKLRVWPHGEVLTYEQTTTPGQMTIEWRFEKDEVND